VDPDGLDADDEPQRIKSIFWTLKDRLGLWLKHYLDRPTRVFAALAA
jgi:hypothetical protein